MGRKGLGGLVWFVFTQRTNFPTYRLKALRGLPTAKAAASQAELFATLETVIFPEERSPRNPVFDLGEKIRGRGKLPSALTFFQKILLSF